MKKFSNTFKMAILTATVPVGMLASTSASAELSASATIASSYLWRGFELGSGTPAISADLVYSKGGFYAGTWVSSGDTTGGTEYDLFAGYGGSIGESITYDISAITYIYPTGQFTNTEQAGDFSEAILNIGLGPVSLTYKDNISGGTRGYAFDEDYAYYSASVSVGNFGFTLGMHDEDRPENVPQFDNNDAPLLDDDGVQILKDSVTGDATHFDVTYSATENLSFTFSTILSSDDGFEEKEPTVVASYSIPLM
jgi:uncharacterized protein (TIGR02001 family)